MRLVGGGAEAAALIGLISLIIALEPFDMAITLKGQDMRGQTVEEPAIMADDHRAAGEIHQRLFQRPQRIDIKVIGRFIKQQDIVLNFEHLGQMHPVALTAREHAHPLLLVAALEVEGSGIGA